MLESLLFIFLAFIRFIVEGEEYYKGMEGKKENKTSFLLFGVMQVEIDTLCDYEQVLWSNKMRGATQEVNLKKTIKSTIEDQVPDLLYLLRWSSIEDP